MSPDQTSITPEQQLAATVTRALGGAENIAAVNNCMTRLRISVVDQAGVDVPALQHTEGVLGVLPAQTMQVVLGPGIVDEVAAEMRTQLAATPAQTQAPTPASPSHTATTPPEHGPLPAIRELLRRIANIFLPLIPALVGCGILSAMAGLLQGLSALGWSGGADELVPFLLLASTALLTLLPLLVGMNAAAEFGGTPTLGAAVAATIPFAALTHSTVLGLNLHSSQGGVLAALFAGALAAGVERWVRGWCPRWLAQLLVPALVVLLAGLVTVLVLVWLGGLLGDGLLLGVDALLGHAGILAGAALGGFFLPLVLLGLHQVLIPLHVTLIQATGTTPLLPLLAMAGAGQVGACAAVWQRARRGGALRQVLRGALPAGLLGVSEPLIYGVTLPLGRPFITACLGGAAGGAVVGLLDQLGVVVGSTAVGPSGWALLPLVTSPGGLALAMGGYAGAMLVAHLVAFVATWFFGFTEQNRELLDS